MSKLDENASWDEKFDSPSNDGGIVLVVSVENGDLCDRTVNATFIVNQDTSVLSRREMMKLAGRGLVQMAYQSYPYPSAIDIMEFIDGVREEYAALFTPIEEGIQKSIK